MVTCGAALSRSADAQGRAAGRGCAPGTGSGATEERSWGTAEQGFDAAVIVAPSFAYASSRGDEPIFAAWGALGVWLTGHLTEHVDLGARAQWVTGLTQRNAAVVMPETILSGLLLTPFVRYVFPHEHAALEPSYVELRTHFNVIAPDGPFLIANPFVWSLGVAAGTNW